MTKATEVEVTQADREAASQAACALDIRWADVGGYFAETLVQAFARHRLAHSAPEPASEEAFPEFISQGKSVADWEAECTVLADIARGYRKMLENGGDLISRTEPRREVQDGLARLAALPTFTKPPPSSEEVRAMVERLRLSDVTMGEIWQAADMLERLASLQAPGAVDELRRIIELDDEANTKWGGLADCTDNDGEPYQSQALANCLARARAISSQAGLDQVEGGK